MAQLSTPIDHKVQANRRALLGRLQDTVDNRIKAEHPEQLLFSEAEARDVWEDVMGGGWEIDDWKHPDYDACETFRRDALARIRKEPSLLNGLHAHYRLNPADFINDWGYTFDPRNVEIDMPARMPFILFPKQREWIEFVVRKWRERRPGLTEKSRDCGISWLAVGLGCTLGLYYTGLNIGYGSRKAEYVDKKGTPKTLFWKARKFMEGLPPEFNGGYDQKVDSPLMRMSFRKTESTLSGEGGDNIGRGDRTAIYFVDEAAYLEQPDSIEASLSATTNCQMDVSSVHGSANPFAIKRFSGKVEVFIFDWRDDPRKDDAWYQKQVDELDPVIVAQEIDRNYQASVAGIVIPNAWIRSAVDAHLKLKVDVDGKKEGALDVADEGKDSNAYAGRHGILINHLEEWSGHGSDIYETAERAMRLAEDLSHPMFRYDADGLGAGLRGDAKKINDERSKKQLIPIVPLAFRGSEAVYNPEAKVPWAPSRTNKDYYANHKAQGWMDLRERFRTTHRAIHEGAPFKPDEIISISSACPLYLKLITELSQPTKKEDGKGRLLIDKKPEGSRSPNLADSVMMLFAPMSAPMQIPQEAITRAIQSRPGQRARGSRRR